MPNKTNLRLTKSIKAMDDAKKVIAGGVNSPVRSFNNVGSNPPFIESGKGAYIYDIDGNKYIDYVLSWGPLILGHCDEQTISDVCKTAQKGLSFGAPNLLETKLAQEILEVYSFLDKLRFVNSGTEAVMSAIRLARAYTKKDDFIKFRGCYHGHSDALLVEAGSGLATFGAPSCPGVVSDYAKHTLLADYNDIKSVEKCFESSNNISCIVIEPIAGNMGFVPADLEFLQALRDLANQKNALLIFDEVMSGFRAGINGVFAYTDVRADIVTFGKVIGGGMPVGAFGAKAHIMDMLSPTGNVYQAGTLSGNPIAMAAGIAALRQIKKDGFFESLTSKTKMLVDGIKAAAKSANVDLVCENKGSMWGYFFAKNAVKNFVDASKTDMQKFVKFHALMLNQGIYLAPSLYETGFVSSAHSTDDINATIKAFEIALKALDV